MSHLDTLAAYQAAAVRVVLNQGEPVDEFGSGGGLADAFDRLGRAPLASVLADAAVASVHLSDGDLVIEGERRGDGARIAVSWGDQAIVDEALALPASSGTVRDLAAHDLGSAEFRSAHGVKWAYIAGAMAGGIGSADILIAMGRAGLMGFFGAGGLPVPAVEAALQRVTAEIPDKAWGFNLLHNPVEPAVEEATVDLYLKYGVKRVSASAYMDLTAAVVRFRFAGIHVDDAGQTVAPNHVFAKVSRVEVADKFMRPPPQRILDELVAAGALTAEQAKLASTLPTALDVTAEGDSGGHTDRRPTMVLLPELQRLRDRIAGELGYAPDCVPRVGAAGGIGTPQAAWGAFAMGADYVMTGSVNQASLEAGTSDMVKQMLAAATYVDVASGPAPDMFEMGAHVQVLGRGSMYAQRGQRLYDLYKRYGSMEEIPDAIRGKIEKQIFKAPLDEIWEGTRSFWQGRDPAQVERAERDGRHKMALTFRWYLGMASRWARLGEKDRKRDFQIWCGPAMGGFNSWVAGTELEKLENRSVVAIADAIMSGAADSANRTIAGLL